MFGKPNAIIYVRRSGLILAGKRIKPARLSFPAEATVNLEVIDAERFGAACADFFADHGVKSQRVLMVLDHNVVFSKSIELDSSGKPALLAKNFISAMPFELSQRACLQLKSSSALRLFAANAPFYDVIASAIKAAGGRVIAITPVAAYGLRESDQLSGAVVDQLLTDTSVRAKADFQSVNPT